VKKNNFVLSSYYFYYWFMECGDSPEVVGV